MSATNYAFKVGQIACTVLLDGVSLVGRAGILKRFPDAAEADYSRAYADLGLSLDEAVSSFNILVARIGAETVLVDSGEGGRPHGGHLLKSMRQAGLDPEIITRVVLTHSHGDHVLGLLSDEHDPVFPNATYVISRDEMTFWLSRIDGSAADQRPIVAMLERQGLRLIEMDEPILPGMTAVPLPGHTPGQIGLWIESDGEKLLHLADMLHNPMQFAHPEWSPTYDVDTRVSVPTRRAALERAADAHLLALFYHLPFPGLGRVRRAEPGFTWAPLALSA
ncbi:MAG: MBL fold metallo-hydrolase [Anaerolineae bacterium]|nr:MBL fold metallo-hydrolase [Anaerolineae bacterium]